jgi:type IV secretory pathway VirB9-like protein
MKSSATAAIGCVLFLHWIVPEALAQSTVPNVSLPNARNGAATVPMPSAISAAPSTRGQQGNVSPQFLAATENSIDQQTRGQFPTMDRAPSLPLGTLQRSWDRPNAASGQTAPGVIHYMWHPDFVMSVRTRDFMVTTLLLPQWERANEFYVGDPVVFEAKKIRSNVIAVRSRNAGADSNLTVLGASGNVYNFYLRSETWNSSQVSDLTVYVDAPRNSDNGESPAGFVGTNAAEEIQGGMRSDGSQGYGTIAGIPDYLRRIVFRPEDLRFDMKMYARNDADTEIAPERIFDDGIFTYFDFGERSDSIARPVVHQLVDGVDTAVNTRTAGPRGNVLIAEAVGDFSLRNGNRVVCVRRVNVKQTATPIVIGGSLPEAGALGRPANDMSDAIEHGGGAKE